MLRNLRDLVKSLPVLGPGLHQMYLKVLKDEGARIRIAGGQLAGKNWVRFMSTFCDQYIDGSYEKSIQQALAKNLCPGMVFYDVGANGGFFSLFGAQLVGPSGTVIAFEPHPQTARQCRAQIDANDFQNVTVVAAAVSDRIGTHKFSDGEFSVMRSLQDAETAPKTIIVKTTTLDHEITKYPPPDVLKIDIEGAEIDALRGADMLLTEKKPILLVEVHSNELAIQYDVLMDRYQYQTFDLDGRPISVAQSKERFVISKYTRSP
jgi:FkbM family methyltransferase